MRNILIIIFVLLPFAGFSQEDGRTRLTELVLDSLRKENPKLSQKQMREELRQAYRTHLLKTSDQKHQIIMPVQKTSKKKTKKKKTNDSSLSLSTMSVTTSSSTFNQVPDSLEYIALRALFQSTDGPNWIDNENWPYQNWPSADTVEWTDFAIWYGIDVENGDVNNLKFKANNLSGAIPDEIGYLTAVDAIDWDHNNITTLPSSIGELTKLSLFYLSSNQLTSLPGEIGRLSSLQNIHLTNNNLQTLPDSIGSCSALLRLYMSGNEVQTLPATIGQLSNLMDLHAEDNLLSEIPSTIGSLLNLSSLALGDNQLTALPAEIGQLQSLSTLDISNNNLTQLPAEIGQLTNLFKLSLSGNDLGALPDEITLLENLSILYADSTNLSSLPADMGLMSYLTSITLSNNRFTEFPPELLDVPFLMEIILNGNEISAVPEEIDVLYDLTFFYIANNNITSLPSSMSSLSWLWGVNVAGNPIGGFPNEVLSFKELLELNVSNLNLNYLPPGIPDSLVYLSDLYVTGNDLDFADLEQFFTGPGESIFPYFYYSPQNNIPVDTSIFVRVGQPLEFAVPVGGEYNIYIWKKKNEQGEWIPVDTTDRFSKFTAAKEDDGEYQAEIRNEVVTGLTLETTDGGIDIDVFNDNYFLEEDILTPGITGSEQVDTLEIGEKTAQWVYFDGLQRQLQSVSQEASPGGHDVVQALDYDELLRQPVSYLPYTTANIPSYTPGEIRPEALYGEQKGFYAEPPPNVVEEDQYSYSAREFEPSPLSRVKEQSGPGEPWSLGGDHTVEQQYLTNGANEVLYWQISGDSVVAEEYYLADELQKTVSVDPQGNQSISYTDKWGRTILQKMQLDDSTWASSYPVYDQLGNLVYNLTPLAVKQANAQTGMPKTVDKETLDLLCYQSEYDKQGRLIKQKAPGIKPVFFVYDRWDRIVLSQDGNQRMNDQWSFTKYDELNQPVITGICTDTRSVSDIREALQNLADSERFEYRDSAGAHGYSNQAFPTSSIDEIHSVFYYDDYNFIADSNLDSVYHYDPAALPELPEKAFDLTQGMPTGSKTNILGTDGYLWTVTYYDDRLREIQTVADNHLGGIDRISDILNFSGYLIKSKIDHNEGDSLKEISIVRRMQYDHVGRVTHAYHQVNDQEEILLSQLRYNELGQVVEKDLHVTDSALQSIDYKYNIQGWLTTINTADLSASDDYDFFGMELAYEQPLTDINNDPQFNGNVSAAIWDGDLDSLSGRAYSYEYDKGSRLSSAQHFEKDAAWNSVTNYSVPSIGYDENGNIQNLTRKDDSGGDLDELSYEYNGNQLKAVTDAGDTTKGFKDGNTADDDYGYDANGNLAFDKNLGIDTIYYYFDNHPDSIVFVNGLAIKYVYDAAGIKLGQRIYNQDTLVSGTDYAGEFVYVDDQIQLIHHEEGRLVPRTTGGFAYQYHLTDHLGNIRVTFTSEPETETTMATMETQNAQSEETQFLKLEDTRTSTVQAIDHTGESEYPKVTRLNGAKGIKEGPGKLVRVMPGDKVKMEVYVKYLDMRRAKSNMTAAALLSALMQSQGVVIPGDPAMPGVASTAIPTEVLAAIGSKADGVPKAFLNYYLFDNNFNSLDAGFVRVSKSAAITPENVNGDHEKLMLEVDVTEPGYLFTHLSHDEPENVDVYFDDFTVIHEHGHIVQAQDYYPFGLAFNAKLQEHAVLNKYLYQGKERLDSLGWDDFHARLYSPALGRFLGVDPQNQFASPYVAMGNNPIILVDPDGEWVHIVIGAVAGGVFNVVTNWNNIDNFGDGLKYFGVGAAGGAAGAATGNFALTGAIIGGGNTALQGGSLTDIAVNTGIGALAGWAGGAVGGQVSGLLASQGLTGGFVGGFASGAAGGITGGFLGGFGTTLYNSGGDFGAAFRAGGKGALYGGLFGGIAGGTVGAIRSFRTGPNGQKHNFWTDAEVAAGRNRFSFVNTPKWSLGVGQAGRVIDSKSIADFARYYDIKGGQKGALNAQIIKKYYDQMAGNKFDPAQSRVGGFIKDGQYILQEGHHRITAAIAYGMKTGNYAILEALMNGGRWTPYYNHGVTAYPFPSKWRY